MQGSTVERMRSKRVRDEDTNLKSNDDKCTRRYRRLYRAIKQGEYLESNTLDNNE